MIFRPLTEGSKRARNARIRGRFNNRLIDGRGFDLGAAADITQQTEVVTGVHCHAPSVDYNNPRATSGLKLNSSDDGVVERARTWRRRDARGEHRRRCKKTCQRAIDLGSGLIDYSQKMTMAAMQMADMKV